jgi:L-lactate dehydrogenase complex protein LldG
VVNSRPAGAKDIVLARVRAALGESPVAPDVPRAYRRTSTPPDLDILVDRLVDYKAVVHRIKADKSGDEGGSEAAAVRRVISEIVGRGALVVPAGLPDGWLPPGVEGLVDDGLSADAIAAADGVVTGAAVAVAETGTIVLDASADQGRRIISLLPDLHICVVREDQVVASVPEAVARLDPRRPLTWISGPSATSDIELNRVEGVHGPRRLHVILVSRDIA